MIGATSAMRSDYTIDSISYKDTFASLCCLVGRHVGRYDRISHPDGAACVSGTTAEAKAFKVGKLDGNCMPERLFNQVHLLMA